MLEAAPDLTGESHRASVMYDDCTVTRVKVIADLESALPSALSSRLKPTTAVAVRAIP